MITKCRHAMIVRLAFDGIFMFSFVHSILMSVWVLLSISIGRFIFNGSNYLHHYFISLIAWNLRQKYLGGNNSLPASCCLASKPRSSFLESTTRVQSDTRIKKYHHDRIKMASSWLVLLVTWMLPPIAIQFGLETSIFFKVFRFFK